MRAKPYTLRPVEDPSPPDAKPISIDNLDAYVQSAPVLWTGWGVYTDTQYTALSPFAIAGGPAAVKLPNNAGSKIETQKPADIATFYNSTSKKLQAKSGDAYAITIDFWIVSKSASLVSFDIWFDMGAPIGQFYNRTITLPKEVNDAHAVAQTLAVYAGDTWQANGAEVYIQADHACEIYGVRYLMNRTHLAR